MVIFTKRRYSGDVEDELPVEAYSLLQIGISSVMVVIRIDELKWSQRNYVCKE